MEKELTTQTLCPKTGSNQQVRLEIEIQSNGLQCLTRGNSGKGVRVHQYYLPLLGHVTVFGALKAQTVIAEGGEGKTEDEEKETAGEGGVGGGVGRLYRF